MGDTVVRKRLILRLPKRFVRRHPLRRIVRDEKFSYVPIGGSDELFQQMLVPEDGKVMLPE